jgi:pyridoxal phosphate enzyme (YggS family)
VNLVTAEHLDLREMRKLELAANLNGVRCLIESAAKDAGRDPSEVTLIGVTKNYPTIDAVLLVELGLRDLGENRAQEGAKKAKESAGLIEGRINWHFIGQLQRNKVRSVLAFADSIHSVDRLSLVETLKVEIARSGNSPRVLIQINLNPELRDRGGANSADLLSLADTIVANGVLLGGVMSVVPIGMEPERAFAEIALMHTDLLRHHPTAYWRSTGMSGDFESAIRAGATHVRIGSSILGSRHLLQ